VRPGPQQASHGDPIRQVGPGERRQGVADDLERPVRVAAPEREARLV
jgi:hypothetical protein